MLMLGSNQAGVISGGLDYNDLMSAYILHTGVGTPSIAENSRFSGISVGTKKSLLSPRRQI
jgi:hypothetical protein